MLTRPASMHSKSGPPPGSWRSVAAVLAFSAFALLVLRPFCELAFGAAHAEFEHAGIAAQQNLAGYDGEVPEVICCASVKESTLAKLAQPIPLAAAAGGAFGAALLLAGFAANPVRRSLARATLGDPAGRTYYARSARILR